MRKTTFLLLLIINLIGCKNRHNDLLLSTMNSFIKDDGNNTGLIFGCNEGGRISIWTVGGISKDDELRVACPTSKPIISYLILKSGIDLNTPISKWFPQKDGYPLSDSITVKMLLLNSSGIMDFVRLVSKQKEFSVMSESYNLDGSLAQNDKLGLGIYLDSNYGGLGKTIYYDGIIGASKMNIYLINNKIYYVYAPYPCQKDLKEIAVKLIEIMNK